MYSVAATLSRCALSPTKNRNRIFFLPPALNQGEGEACLRAAPARARRGRLSINTPMCRHTALHLGCRFHMHYITCHKPLSVVFCCLPAICHFVVIFRIAGEHLNIVGPNMAKKMGVKRLK